MKGASRHFSLMSQSDEQKDVDGGTVSAVSQLRKNALLFEPSSRDLCEKKTFRASQSKHKTAVYDGEKHIHFPRIETDHVRAAPKIVQVVRACF